MHRHFNTADALTLDVIAAAIEVHRALGPSLLESIYETCFDWKLRERGIQIESQRTVPITYERFEFEQELRLDLIVVGCLVVEVKAVTCVTPIMKAQLLSYMKLLDVPVGLRMNFHAPTLKSGLSRLILKAADSALRPSV
ncbi:MAG: GxxExxY protein [Opitutales bacterium]